MRVLIFPLLVALCLAHQLAAATEPADDLSQYAEIAASIETLFEDGYRFIFVGSSHGGEKRHAFLLSLISAAAREGRLTDVIVEFSSAAHQDLMDAYLLDLEEIPAEELVHIWQDTLDLGVWPTMPQPERFFHAMRRINAGLPRERRIRVLGGHPPIPWQDISTVEDLSRYPPKNNFTANRIVHELYPDDSRYVIVAYGEGHNYFNGGFMMGHIIGQVPASALFVIGAVTKLREEERVALQELGDPARPFFVDFSAQSPGALQFGNLFYSRGRPLDKVLSGLVYLGPAADVRADGSVELSPELAAELRRRRDLIMDDRYLDLQFDNRQHWFDTSEE